jgi:hypothetical protein
MNIAQRQKQIDYGKNTLGYSEYLKKVPKEKRSGSHPKTPEIGLRISKRAFDGIVRRWRKSLHQYDLFKTVSKKQVYLLQKSNLAFSQENFITKSKKCNCFKRAWMRRRRIIRANIGKPFNVNCNVQMPEFESEIWEAKFPFSLIL